jgi:hypothetical protein
VTARLDPSTHDVQFFIERPDGREVAFEPPFARCVVREPRQIAPDQPEYMDVCLSYGRGGNVLVEPGHYRVRAVLYLPDLVLMSNTLMIFIRYPTPDVEDAVVPALSEEVAAYMALGGGYHLHGARARLQALSDALPYHPLAKYFRLYEGMIKARGFTRLTTDRKGFQRVLGPNPDPIELVQALDIGQRTKSARTAKRRVRRQPDSISPFSNVFLERHGQKCFRALETAAPKEAERLLDRLTTELTDRRKVPLARLLSASTIYRSRLEAHAPGRKK